MVVDVIAATRIQDLLAPKDRGERVNAYVRNAPPEPKPDFDAMQKVIKGHNQQLVAMHDTTKREVPEGD